MGKMTVKKIPGWSERTGDTYWGGDRIERMTRTRNLESERSGLALLNKIDMNSIETVADLGSGIGRRHIYFPEKTYVGFDRERVMIENGKKYFPHLELHLVDAMELLEKLPEMRERFDLLLTFHVLQYNHIDQQDEIIQQIYGMLKPGGLYYLKENTIYEHNNIGYSTMGDTRSINGHSYTEAGWIKKLEGFGFKLLHTVGRDGHFIFQK
jgi:SAM-dependent methyltransferase